MSFINDFFNAMDADQAVALTDSMDSFEKYISNDLEIAKVSVMRCMGNIGSIEDRVVLSSCMVCNILAQSAKIVWGDVYKTQRRNPMACPDLVSLCNSTLNFMNEYHRFATDIDCNRDSGVVDAVDVLCKKMIKWLYKCSNDEKNEL